jgi:hypothetical protein
MSAFELKEIREAMERAKEKLHPPERDAFSDLASPEDVRRDFIYRELTVMMVEPPMVAFAGASLAGLATTVTPAMAGMGVLGYGALRAGWGIAQIADFEAKRERETERGAASTDELAKSKLRKANGLLNAVTLDAAALVAVSDCLNIEQMKRFRVDDSSAPITTYGNVSEQFVSDMAHAYVEVVPEPVRAKMEGEGYYLALGQTATDFHPELLQSVERPLLYDGRFVRLQAPASFNYDDKRLEIPEYYWNESESLPGIAAFNESFSEAERVAYDEKLLAAADAYKAEHTGLIVGPGSGDPNWMHQVSYDNFKWHVGHETGHWVFYRMDEAQVNASVAADIANMTDEQRGQFLYNLRPGEAVADIYANLHTQTAKTDILKAFPETTTLVRAMDEQLCQPVPFHSGIGLVDEILNSSALSPVLHSAAEAAQGIHLDFTPNVQLIFLTAAAITTTMRCKEGFVWMNNIDYANYKFGQAFDALDRYAGAAKEVAKGVKAQVKETTSLVSKGLVVQPLALASKDGKGTRPAANSIGDRECARKYVRQAQAAIRSKVGKLFSKRRLPKGP